jgi:hypothetical protein
MGGLSGDDEDATTADVASARVLRAVKPLLDEDGSYGPKAVKECRRLAERQ